MRSLSNTSPLYYLHRLNRLELLPQLFGSIAVPNAVIEELANGRQAGYRAPDVTDLPWIEVLSVQPAEELLPYRLGPGEFEVLSLALETPSAKLFLDDREARLVAARYGFDTMGTAGILRMAHDRGLIEALAPCLDQLRAEGFYLSEPLYRRLLGET